MATSDQVSAYYKASDWLSDGTLRSLDYFRNLNQGNDAAAAAVNDLYYNAASADLQTRSDVNYAKQMIPLALDLQRGQQQIASQADLQRLSSEGAIVRDLVGMQGKYEIEGKKIDADAMKYGYDAALKGTKYSADRNLEGTKYSSDAEVSWRTYTADRDMEWRKYVSDRDLEGVKYGADRGLEGIKYGADRNLEGVKYGWDSQERQIGLQGTEDRKNMVQATDETLRLRADARGAIRTAGKQFYG